MYGVYLGHHLEEGEGDDLLGHLDHLVKVDRDRARVVVDAGQETGGEGHVCTGFPLGVHRRVAMLHVG